MEPDVIRIYSSSPPPMEDGAEDEDDEFGDFGTFSGLANSVSFSEFDTPSSFNQSQALTATSPPDVQQRGGALIHGHAPSNEPSKANGVGPFSQLAGSPSEVTETRKTASSSPESSVSESADCNGEDSEVLTNGFVTFDLQESPPSQTSVPSHVRGPSAEDGVPVPEDEFADFASFSNPEETTLQLEESPPETAVPFWDSGGESEAEDGVAATADGCCDCGALQTDAAAPESPHTVHTNGTYAEDEPGGAAGEGELSSGEAAPSDEKSSETSLGRPLSTDGLEDYGDTSAGSAPSPPLRGAATPAEDDEDFGDAGSFGGQFEALGSGPPSEPAIAVQDDDFRDFSPTVLAEDGGQFTDFPTSDSFGNFSSATDAEDNSGWSAFGETQNQEEAESWAAFSSVPSAADGQEEERDEGPTAVAPSSRLETLFLISFPSSSAHSQRPEGKAEPLQPGSQEEAATCLSAHGGVWTRLWDVQDAVGLRYQWGGSHCNKLLLCCLGIDTRNILFTGQKKHPVIVPMFAAGLGMLEPTKEPAKPVSAVEMIASIAQTPPGAAEQGCRQPDPVQEALPPVQFDWSSSGLTNPLDGVDPELFELTTAKLDPGGAGSRVADAFARLMSTMEKTSTSARKPRRDENLSAEASKVIVALPDLSFMQAKVLMFPATLTPLCSQATPD